MRTPVTIVNPATGTRSTVSPVAFERVWGPAGYTLADNWDDLEPATHASITNPNYDIVIDDEPED